MTHDLAILGAGNMAEAIARGVIRSGAISPEKIIAADVSAERRELFQSQLRIRTTTDNNQAAADCRALLLSVKPYQIKEVLAGVGQVLNPQTLVISIAAGIGSGFIARSLGERADWRIIRVMPNTPMLVGEGMAALSRGAHATAEDVAAARRIFESAASVIEVPEEQIDAVTAVSGSGPAYLFFLVEQMIAAGVALGLSLPDAEILAKKTAVGAAKIMWESKDTPAELRKKVTTPNGTTHAAISHLEYTGWPAATIEAIEAAARRSKEMGQ
jgi:pyrroline-5-carboxylate reductase